MQTIPVLSETFTVTQYHRAKSTNDMHTMQFYPKLLQSRYNIIDIKNDKRHAYNTIVETFTVTL
jgi:hypothetical protein